MTTERATLTVSTASWHGKAYAYWRRHAHFKKYSYKENLCHYVRVVLFWAPLAWWMNASPFEDGSVGNAIVRPVSIAAALGVMAGIAAALLLAPAGSLVFFLYLLACIGGTALIGTASFLTAEEVEWWVKPWCFLGRIIARIAITLWRLLFRWWLVPLYDHVLEPIGIWLTNDRNNRYDIPPIGIIAVALLGAVALSFLGLAIVTQFGYFMLAVVGLVTLAAVVAGFYSTRHFWRKAVLSPTASFSKVLAHRAVAQKHSICPFIEIQD